MQADTETVSLGREVIPARLLLLGGPESHDDAVLDSLKSRGFSVVSCSFSSTSTERWRAVLSTSDIVLVDLTTSHHSILKELENLNASIGIANMRPRLLCFSSVHRSPHFELAVEKCGARYVRINNPDILLDAVDFVSAEMEVLRRNGVSFEIIHAHSQGTCAPGESVLAVRLTGGGNYIQLRLPLAQRLLFNFFAEHRRVALDSSQIVSGLNGWFYREHAGNSGNRQVKKIRKAAISSRSEDSRIFGVHIRGSKVEVRSVRCATLVPRRG